MFLHTLVLVMILASVDLLYCQQSTNEKLIELGKAYKNFMFRNEPTPEFLEDIQSNITPGLEEETKFIKETISNNNLLLSEEYLTLPDSQTLKNIYIIREINYNVRCEDQIDNNYLVDSLLKAEIPKNELISSYYSMLFTGVGNKIKPFDLSDINFNLKKYNLQNETEKGIFFLQCMEFCGKTIWGFINIPKPSNTEKAYSNISKFPKFNGLKYYQYTDLYFPDFQIILAKTDGYQSYKSYFLDKYYDLLLSHLLCLNKENNVKEEIHDLLLGSILKDNNLYKYTKNKEELEKIFEVQKK